MTGIRKLTDSRTQKIIKIGSFQECIDWRGANYDIEQVPYIILAELTEEDEAAIEEIKKEAAINEYNKKVEDITESVFQAKVIQGNILNVFNTFSEDDKIKFFDSVNTDPKLAPLKSILDNAVESIKTIQ